MSADQCSYPMIKELHHQHIHQKWDKWTATFSSIDPLCYSSPDSVTVRVAENRTLMLQLRIHNHNQFLMQLGQRPTHLMWKNAGNTFSYKRFCTNLVLTDSGSLVRVPAEIGLWRTAAVWSNTQKWKNFWTFIFLQIKVSTLVIFWCFFANYLFVIFAIAFVIW